MPAGHSTCTVLRPSGSTHTSTGHHADHSAAPGSAKRRSDQPTGHKRSPAQKRARPAGAPFSGDKQGSNKKLTGLSPEAAEAPTQAATKLASAPAASQGGWQVKQSAQKKKPPAATKAAQGVTAADVSAARVGPTPSLASRQPRQQAGAAGSTATALPTSLQPGAVVWTKFGAFLWPAQLLSTKAGSEEGVVQLFGIHTRISVLLSGLEAFSGQPDKCVRLHSELGKQVSSKLMLSLVYLRTVECRLTMPSPCDPVSAVQAIMEALQHLETLR